MKTVIVTVRRKGDTNIAHVGKGGYARTASSTNAPYFAAQTAAKKFLIEGRAHLKCFEVRLSPTWEENANAESYTATLVKKVRPVAKPLRKTSVKPGEKCPHCLGLPILIKMDPPRQRICPVCAGTGVAAAKGGRS